MRSIQLYRWLTIVVIGSAILTACSDISETNEEQVNEAIEEEINPVETQVAEVEPEIKLEDYIKGTWAKIAQSCDSDGNNCDETPGSDWIFDGEEVSLGRISQPYRVANDTIYIVDSPYEITKEWGDTILLHGINADRYMKLVRK